MNFVIYIVLLALRGADASDAPKGWSEWASEGNALSSAGKYAAAAEAFRHALTVAKGTDIDDRRLAGIYGALAEVYAEAGQFAESEREYRRALALVAKAEGRYSLDYAMLFAGMAVLPTQNGDSSEEIALLTRTIAINRRTGSARDLAIVRISLAEILMEQKRYAEAEPLLLDTQSDLASHTTANPKLLAASFNHLGLLRYHQGRYAESVDLYRESLRVVETYIAGEQSSLVMVFNNLATSYVKMGRLDDANQTYRRAIPVCSNTLGEDHPTCGVLLDNYAFVLRRLGRKREAKMMAARSRQIERAAVRRNGIGSTIGVTSLRSSGN